MTRTRVPFGRMQTGAGFPLSIYDEQRRYGAVHIGRFVFSLGQQYNI